MSPASLGKNTLGSNDGSGHGATVNPATGAVYAANNVKEADFGRILVEFWADGPTSETPPGHWVKLANEIADHALSNKKFMGIGSTLDRLEWEVKLYFALTGALFDSAIAVWDAKAKYDYVRPITSIRRMGYLGQSTNNGNAYYNSDGLPITANLIEIINSTTRASTLSTAGFTALDDGRMAVKAWAGEPANTVTDTSGVKWIRADKWLPYQRSTFITPPFAGYVSGHSTYSRAARSLNAIYWLNLLPWRYGYFHR
jgi:hypothetical protein